ncbi:MAG: type II toxin-antitoxin system RelE/ParE family toxin [Thermodesulfovibrionales bacterium]|nr:type II toxin-antitoxin system RelE/ParE family toxin [Thermodesulfovibrionales bacterium]
MASYSIFWKHSAEHDLRRLDRSIISRLLEAIEALSENPFPPQSKKLAGSESTYRIRIGDYRAIYQVGTEAKIVTVYNIRHRREAYR